MSAVAHIRIAIWNIQRKRPNSEAGRSIRAIIERADPDLVVLTEAFSGSLGWNEIVSGPHYAARMESERKVVVYSRRAWSEVDMGQGRNGPDGRYVSAMTYAAGTKIRCIGVCVPWSGAATAEGPLPKWQAHREFLAELKQTVLDLDFNMPVIVAGDFNQHVPRVRAPRDVYGMLDSAFSDQFTCFTAGPQGLSDLRVIDHLFASKHFKAPVVQLLANTGADGRALSDHAGLLVSLDVNENCS